MRKLISIPILILLFTACAHTGEQGKSVLNLEVGIDYKYGGVQPVARQEFYLLNADLNELLGGTAEGSKIRLWELTSFVDGSWGEKPRRWSDLTETYSDTHDRESDYRFARKVNFCSCCSRFLLHLGVVNDANRASANDMELSSGL